MYKKANYKYGRPIPGKTGKQAVLSDLIEDLSTGKPDFVRMYKTIIKIGFIGKYTTHYIIPISCKYLIEKEGKNV